MSGIEKMLKKAQQMQRDMEQVQNELAEMEITYSGNGVEVVAKGDSTIKSITIAPDLLESAEDKDMLEDCVLVAVNGALNKIREETQSRMSGITGGLNLPGLF